MLRRLRIRRGGRGHRHTLDFYTDKAAWKPDFESLNEVSGDAVDITLKTTRLLRRQPVRRLHQAVVPHRQVAGTVHLAHRRVAPSTLVDEGLVAETTDIWSKAVDEGWVSEDLRDSYTFDGKQYCVPMNIAYWIMFYNKAAFADNGIEGADDLGRAEHRRRDAEGCRGHPYYQTSVLFTFQWFQHLVAATDPRPVRRTHPGRP
ncbi:extracellular solute-binding protein [Microbacterium oxydans]|nr:extracellular solute-binding protein [Microbacterium oxydans]